jgi:phosphopantothenoylcysteine decarboxylase/phosphopantothenate--cysteine ligase
VKKGPNTIRGARILLGVTGGIAAYKSAYLVRRLTQAGATVRVVMTRAAGEFITPLTFSALSNYPVAVDLWSKDQATDSKIGTKHISLASWCDLMLIAPASANTLAKIAHGFADNLLTVLTLACRKRVVLAPTMDADMYINEATQHHISVLRERGFDIIPPDVGEHASGLMGPGRLPEVESITTAVEAILRNADQDLKGKRFVVTAGPTHEPIDPVRFIGNRSSGKTGFAIAREAAKRGARVTLVSGPVDLETPRLVTRVNIETADEMLAAVRKATRSCDVLVMAAAVADYAPAKISSKKIKKSGDALSIVTRKTPDILASIAMSKKKIPVTIGFALETHDAEAHAREKLRKKSLDMIVLNTLSKRNQVFGSDMNTVTLMKRSGNKKKYPQLEKSEVARILVDAASKML